MPYYCTVPRCTSMAGKTKDVSFHQFPRDEQLASLWNKILKRGKPYTKYSKVCSLHFRAEDYTITSVGKNKGQWRTLRKDAIPSQNLPTESPVPPRRNSLPWPPTVSSEMANTTLQQQMAQAQAIYMQTMLAMQAGTGCLPTQSAIAKSDSSHTSTISITDLEQILKHTPKTIESLEKHDTELRKSYKCLECSKCFKDPDVFVLHRRSHNKNERLNDNISSKEKENLNSNSDLKQATLQANPILANLLKNDVPNANLLESNNVFNMESQIMTALTANMENYLRNLTSLFSQRSAEQESENNTYSSSDDDCDDAEIHRNEQHDSVQNGLDLNEEGHDSNQECQSSNQECQSSKQECHDSNQDCHDSNRECQSSNEENHNLVQNIIEGCPSSIRIKKSLENIQESLSSMPIDGRTESCRDLDNQLKIKGSNGPLCDNEDLNNSKDSINLVIDENA